MHKSIKDHLEEYLEGGGRGDLAEFHAHLKGCEGCREEVGAMERQARMLRLLASPTEVETPAGFYARVMERIEARRSASVGYTFLEPVFCRRLILASLTALAVLGSFLVYTAQAPPFGASNPVTIMAAQPSDYDRIGADPEHDREAVLFTLASYQE